MEDKKTFTHSILLTKEQIALLHSLIPEDCEFSTPEYMQWKASKKGLSIAVYNSNKIVIQGSSGKDFVEFTLEPLVTKEAKLGYENSTNSSPNSNPTDEVFVPHIGIDESGKGDFFGPLVVASGFVKDEDTAKKLLDIGVRDSKKISSDNQIFTIASKIKQLIPNQFSGTVIGNKAYNDFYLKVNNLNKMLAWGHSRALENILERVNGAQFALSDKFADERLIQNALMEKGKTIKLLQRVRAESDIAVATASILARAEFVKRMDSLSKDMGINIPRGASVDVVNAGVQIIRKYGLEKLQFICKMHFKTYQKVIEECKNNGIMV